MENKIMFLDCNEYSPMYQSDGQTPVKLRFFNGKEFSWLDFYPQNDIIHGLWINKSFTKESAKNQIDECLKSSPYVIISWRKSNEMSGQLSLNKPIDISMLSNLLELSIIGVDNLYIPDELEYPEWFVK